MQAVIADYFREISERFAQAWNRFWFTPTDALTLSLVRVLGGLVAFYTILTYTPDLEALFGVDGLLPADNMRRLQNNFFSISYLYWLETPSQLWAAHLGGLVVLAAFALGLFTRVTSVLSLVVLLSYFNRSFVVTAEMEPVLATVVFYLCLGQSGEYFSLDAWRRRRTDTAPAHRPAHWTNTIAIRLLQVHLTIIYVMMLLAQLHENTWWDGTAVWWLAGRQDSAMFDFTDLYVHPWVVNFWTHSFIFYEGCFAVLAWNRLAAPLLVVLGVVVWGLMGLLTGLLPLAAIMVIASLAFIRPESLRTLLGCCGLARLVE